MYIGIYRKNEVKREGETEKRQRDRRYVAVYIGIYRKNEVKKRGRDRERQRDRRYVCSVYWHLS